MARGALAGASRTASSKEPVLGKVRIPFVQRVRLTWKGETREAFLVDLALSGVFVECAEALAVGEPVELSFRLPGNAIAISARGRVAWRHLAGTSPVALPTGVGVEFQDLAAPDHGRLREYLTRYCRQRSKARRFARHWPGEEERS